MFHQFVHYAILEHSESLLTSTPHHQLLEAQQLFGPLKL
jgi:hypothetical protein